jgi:hypothetical protein
MFPLVCPLPHSERPALAPAGRSLPGASPMTPDYKPLERSASPWSQLEAGTSTTPVNAMEHGTAASETQPPVSSRRQVWPSVGREGT